MADSLDVMDEIEAFALGIAPQPRKPPSATELKLVSEEITPLVKAFQEKNIRMRGTVDDPLICVTDAAEYIGDLNYRRKVEKYTLGKFMQNLPTTDIRGQKRQMQYFTEAGFYKYMMQSRGEKAEEFQLFVYELLKEERRKTVDSTQLALKIARTEIDELRKTKASLERKQTSMYKVANDAKEHITSLKEENKTLRRQRHAAADAEEMRLLGRGGEQIVGWNC